MTTPTRTWRDARSLRLPGVVARKRIADLLTLALLSPLIGPIGLMVALAVRVGIGSPVLFRQERIGYEGRVFSAVKFRSMTSARDASGALLPDADRLTPFGSFMRRSSLDELPQLWNVLVGDMSLVGPRPLFVHYGPHYTADEARRHHVRPGITGLAQVAGRNDLHWDHRLQIDTAYVDSLSHVLDGKILWQTALRVLKREDVVVIAGHSGEPLDVERSYPTLRGLSMRKFSLRDIPERVLWMNDAETARHMRLPDDVNEESTTEWFVQAHRSLDRHDFIIYEIATKQVVAMIGLKKSATGLPDLYMFVDPARHGGGLGRTSLGLLFMWLRLSGAYDGCKLEVTDANRKATALYSSFGFSHDESVEPGRSRMHLHVADWAGTE